MCLFVCFVSVSVCEFYVWFMCVLLACEGVECSGYANDDNRRAERGRRIASLGTPGGDQPTIRKN